MPADLLDRIIDAVRRRGRLIEHLLEQESPELFIAVFPEPHVASHMLWHTARGVIDPAAPVAAESPGLIDVFRELDRQIGRVMTRAGDDAAVLVFTLYGMRDGRGVPLVLDPLFRSVGLAAWTLEPALPTLRRRAPTALKRLYHHVTPIPMRLGLARYGLIPSYDWSRTKAFPLPTDQHGLIRVNLKGREAKGIVEPAEYDRLCGEIAGLVGQLQMEDGTPVVESVVRMAVGDPVGAPSRLPDLSTGRRARRRSPSGFALRPFSVTWGRRGSPASTRRTVSGSSDLRERVVRGAAPFRAKRSVVC